MNDNKDFRKITLIYLIVLTLFVGVRIASNLGAFSSLDEWVAELSVTGLIQIVIMFGATLALYVTLVRNKNKNVYNIKQTFKDFGYKKINLRTILISVALGIIVFLLNIVIASLFDYFIALLGYEPISGGSSAIIYNTVPTLLLGILSVAILPALCEEFLHRGLMVFTLKDKIGKRNAILLSGLLFGLMHLNIGQFFYATVLGFFIAFVAIISNSIWPAIIIHFMNNFINVYLSFASNTGSWFSNFYTEINSFFSVNSFGVVLVCLTAIAISLTLLTIWLVIKLYNINNKENQIYCRLITPNSLKSEPSSGTTTVQDCSIPADANIPNTFVGNKVKV